MRTTSRCSSGSVPQKGYRHLLKRRDLERFIELIPNWDELSDELYWIVLGCGDEDYMGSYTRGMLTISAWRSDLWTEDLDRDWYQEHVDILERLDVACWKVGPRWVAEWTEEQARAFQLIHVFLHELGHHNDRITNRGRRLARGEPYAETFALELADVMWDDFVRVFPL